MRHPPRRRVDSRCVCLLAAFWAGGCAGSGDWTNSAWDTPPIPASGQPDAFAVVAALTVGAVLAVGSAAVHGITEALQHWSNAGGPGVAYDSPEGRAQRIPNDPLQEPHRDQNENGSSTLGR